MEYSHRYPAYPTQEVATELERHIDIHRQAYNYTLYEYKHVDADNIGSAYKHHYRLPAGKKSSLSSQKPTRRLCNELSHGYTRTSTDSPSRNKTGTTSGSSSGSRHGNFRV
jgi:putative transposase